MGNFFLTHSITLVHQKDLTTHRGQPIYFAPQTRFALTAFY
ncbi:hypothetical protein N184_37125 [Sinorhizobium sp. GL28]|nr:hypothetical protein N184_37125 [Sinorhizobium sp. GL28]